MLNQKSIKGTFFVTLMLILAACGEVGPSPSFSSVSNSNVTNSETTSTTSFMDSSSSSVTSSSSSSSTASSSEVPSEEQYQIYLLALQSGYEGTYEEWLDSIKGADGSSLLNGETDPEASIGNNGDTYINTSTWDVFIKVGGNWTKVGNVMGPKGETGEQGPPGADGQDGLTPYIGTNGNWWIGMTDTGIPATGPAGENGTNGTNGVDGADGQDGLTPYIGTNGNWWIGTTDTGIPATGPAGENGTNGTNGVDGPAGENGTNGTNGVDGQDGVNGEDGLSAYEIYKKYYPGYPGTEQDWINDFVTNQLVKTVTLNFDGGTTSTYKTTYFKGEQLETLPTTTKQYYTFDSWQVNNQTISNTYYVVGNITITAKWNIVEGTILVTNAAELNNIRNFLNGTFLLANDIDLGSQEWTPIGSDTEPFTGFLDGQGYTISNLKITESQVYVGLFGYNEGAITNLKLDKVNISVIGGILSNIYSGALVGYNSSNANLENLHTISGEIAIEKRAENLAYLGGLMGYSDKRLNLNNVSNNLSLIGLDSSSIGGIIGYGYGTIFHSSNKGPITGHSSAGGLIGEIISYSTIEKSFNLGEIRGTSQLGGLVGSAKSSGIELIIDDSHNMGSLSTTSGQLGGLLGFSIGGTKVNRSYNLGLLSGLSSIGGLIGESSSTIGLLEVGGSSRTVITQSYNTGHIYGNSSIGGLLGKGRVSIINSFNSGNLLAANAVVGGLIGYNSGSLDIENSYNLGSVEGTSSLGGLFGYSLGPSRVTNKIKNSFNLGEINGTLLLAGIGGNIDSNIQLENVINMGNVIGTGHGIGGLIGIIERTVTLTNCLNQGEILGTDYVGGLVGQAKSNITIIKSLNSGNASGREYVGGLVGFSNNSLFVYYSVNFGNVIASSNTTQVGGVTGRLPTTIDIEQTYHSGSITSNGIEFDGVAFGTKVTDLSTFNLAFFTTTLEWDTEIWDFTGLDIANGVYPTLKNMPEIPVEE